MVDMEMLKKLKKLLCKQLSEYAELPQLGSKALDDVADMVKTIKNIDRIMEHEDGGQASMRGYSMGSYADEGAGASTRRGRDSMGRYTSRDGGSYGDSHYSYDDDRAHMVHELRNMMETSQDPEVQKALRRAMQSIDRM